MAQYPKIESIGSIGSIILAILEVQVDLRDVPLAFAKLWAKNPKALRPSLGHAINREVLLEGYLAEDLPKDERLPVGSYHTPFEGSPTLWL